MTSMISGAVLSCPKCESGHVKHAYGAVFHDILGMKCQRCGYTGHDTEFDTPLEESAYHD